MKHKAKWLGGVGLSLALLLSLLPATAFAAGTDEARIGTTDYPTLEEAFEKAKNGDTVTLLKDVTKEGPGTYMDGTDKAFYKLTGGGTITLDLNGNTLTMNKIGQMYQTTGGIELIDRSLTIRDSVGGGKITGTSRWGRLPDLRQHEGSLRRQTQHPDPGERHTVSDGRGVREWLHRLCQAAQQQRHPRPQRRQLHHERRLCGDHGHRI